MKTNIVIISVLIAVLAFIFNGCSETYPLLTNTYEEALVVEATLTNELKHQEIKLTKTSKFEDKLTQTESGANVFVTDDLGNKYEFQEGSEKYVSKIEFQALIGRKYQLHIITIDGRSFESSPEILTTINPIKNLTATLEKDKYNLRGVAIRVNSFDDTNSSKYYRYEYEETYKIVAPKWVTTTAIARDKNTFVFADNPISKRVCYGNSKSTEILLSSTNSLNEDRVNFIARFISDQNYIITTRYSILVKQYVESLAAYTYYKTLKEMSNSESILSPKQPGLLLGNLKAIDNSNNKIIGFFDVASVSSERIYFNYVDLFNGEAPPPYYTDCQDFCYALWPNSPIPCTHDVGGFYDDFDRNVISYFTNRLDIGYLFWVNAPCADCTTFASNIKPTFWTD